MKIDTTSRSAHTTAAIKTTVRLMATVILLTACLAPAAQAASSSSSSKGTTTSTTSSKTKGKVRVIKGTEESASERTQRLKRECKGRPNAGACAGYTS